MQIDLAGTSTEILGHKNPVSDAVGLATKANGTKLVSPDATLTPDILVVSLPLRPVVHFDAEPIRQKIAARIEEMKSRGSGRVVFLLSAAAGMPMRRHPEFSVLMSAMLTYMRTLAMSAAPEVLVNAIGVGAIGTPLVAGDKAMIGHGSIGRAGLVGEVTEAVLFLCDPSNTYLTGQVLNVDGGWNAGYGRNF